MQVTDTGKVDLAKENSSVAANQLQPPVGAPITTLVTQGEPAPNPAEWQKMFTNNGPTHVSFNQSKADMQQAEAIGKEAQTK